MTSPAEFALKSQSHRLDGAGLHDATLHTVTFDWKAAEATLKLLLMRGIPATLAFHGVTAMFLPRDQPWGPSSCINEAQELSVGTYQIELQSGDVLQFKAASWSLHIAASPSEA